MKKILILALIASVGITSTSAVTIDFEGYDDATLIDDQYVGLGADFNGTATILTIDIGLNPIYPPYSGKNVVYDAPGSIIRVDSVGSSWSSVSGYITGNTIITLKAYDSGGNLLGSDATAGANYIGAGTPNDLLSVTAANIDYITLSDSGNTFTLDDFSFEPTGTVPEFQSTISFLGLGLAGLVGFWRRLCNR
jgi:hypothetical protein